MIIRGDARHIPLRDRTVQCVVTSPPYFQLRDYQCGPAQLGLEATPEQYVGALVEVFREVRRVLRDDGVLWLVLGDSFNAGVRTDHGPVRPDAPRLRRRDLIGIPWQVLIGPKGLAEGKVEVKTRNDGRRELMSPDEALARLSS